MSFKKLLYIREEHKEALDDIKKKIEENGGRVSMMSLIDDSIQVFIDYYEEEAVKRYSPKRYKERKINGE